MITIERASMIARAMGANEADIEMLLSLSPEDAAAKMNAKGNDFTAQELVDFVEYIKSSSIQEGELSEDVLGQVSGGVVAELAFCGGVLLGMYLNKKGIW